MTYNGTATCGFCNKQFEFSYTETVRTKYSSGELPKVMDYGVNAVCFNFIEDGIPHYSVLCPYCGREHHLSQDEASIIPLPTSDS